VIATVTGAQLALRDRGTTVAPVSTTVEDGAAIQKAGMAEAGITSVGAPGSARIDPGESTKVSAQKAGMVQAGVTSVGGGPKGSPGRDQALDATVARIDQAR
jgi:hypothetical protein